MFMQVKGTNKVRVTWPEPIFKDNIGVKRVTQSLRNNKLHNPTSFNVLYDAYDAVGNAASCLFKVHIESEFILLIYKNSHFEYLRFPS
jgi:HYR domain.